MKRDLFPIGRVVKPHGIRGKIKVEYFGEDPTRFPPLREVFIEDSTGKAKTYEILEAIPQPPRLILRLKGIERIEEVASLVGKAIFVQRERLPDLDEGEYYWVDLLGLVVETEKGKRIGKVKEIFPTGANDVFVVAGKRKDLFLPATEQVIRDINLQQGVIKVSWMEGLWEEEDEV